MLNETDLITSVGLSADDPLAARHREESFRVFVTLYAPDGEHSERHEVALLKPGGRLTLNLSEMVQKRFPDRNCLVVVHRVPVSLCPLGTDPGQDMRREINAADFHMYRVMAQYAVPGGSHGGVIYETPPGFNDTRRLKRSMTMLSFSSKVALSSLTESLLCLIHYSVNPAYVAAARIRMNILDDAGTILAGTELNSPGFTASLFSFRKVMAGIEGWTSPERLTNLTYVAWSRDAALIPLLIQKTASSRSVTVEHTHPPQTYMLPIDPRLSHSFKERAIAQWEARFRRTV